MAENRKENLKQQEIEKQKQENVKAFQVSMAKSMKIREEVISILAAEDNWVIREWLYICALDGMSMEEIQYLSKEHSLERIINAKRMFNYEKFGNLDVLRNLIDEAKEVERNSKKTRNLLENKLKETENQHSNMQTAIIREKEKRIKEKDQLIQEKQERISELEEQIRLLKMLSDQHPTKIDISEKKEKSESKNQEDKNLENKIEAIKNEPVIVEYERKNKKENSKWNRFRAYFTQKPDTKRFVEKYLENDEYTEEQKEFLIGCLEEGLSVKEIEKFAAPGLSVNIMKRMKRYGQSGK